jgi:hypothetical protein
MTENEGHYELVIEVRPDDAGSYQQEGSALVTNASRALEAAGATLAEAAGSFRKRLAATAPDEIELEVKLLLKGETRWLIVTGGEASMVVKMKWKLKEGATVEKA